MFFKKVIKKAESLMDTVEDIDEHFFAEVMDEISDGYKDKGIYGKSIAMCAGDEAKINSLYIKLRAKALQEEYKKEQIEVSRVNNLLIKMEHELEKEEIEKNNRIFEMAKQGHLPEKIKDRIIEDGYTFISNKFVRKNNTFDDYRVVTTESGVFLLKDNKTYAEYDLFAES